MPLRRLGRAFVATSDDGTRTGVVGICEGCISAETRLPLAIRGRRYLPGLDRALDDPERYFVTVYADPGAADLALALLAHPAHRDDALVALGWREPDCRRKPTSPTWRCPT